MTMMKWWRIEVDLVSFLGLAAGFFEPGEFVALIGPFVIVVELKG